MSKELVLSPNEFGIKETKAKELMGNLPQLLNERKELEKQFDEIAKMDVDNPETSKIARELRLLIQKNRTQGINVWHKTTKDYFLKGGQFVDAIKRKEIVVNERMESDLEQIEKYAEIKEQKRRDELKSKRISELEIYSEFVPFGIELGIMTDEEYVKVFNGAKMQYDAKVKAEKEAELERIENERKEKLHKERKQELAPYWDFVPSDKKDMDFSSLTDVEWKERFDYSKNAKAEHEAEQERIRKENEALRLAAEKKQKEIEAKEKKIKERNEKLRPYIIFIRDYDKVLALSDSDFEKELTSLNKQAIEQLKFEQEQEAKRQAELKAEREKQAKLQAQIKAKEDAEKEAAEAEAKRIQSELNKGDADKVKDLISDLQGLKTKYSFKSEKNRKMYSDVSLLIDKVINHVNK